MSLVKEIISRAESLPAMPAIAQQILSQVRDPHFSYKNLMNTVRLDPGITAHVLRMCNSPFYGLRRKISSLEQALAYLGSNNIMEIVLSSQVIQFFRRDQEGYRLTRGDLWRHSMATALLAQRLGEISGYQDGPTLFTAALLHDVGKLLLSEYVGQKFLEIEKTVEEKGISFVEAERMILGVDHAVLGGVVARHWNFPEDIVTAIAFHHNSERATHDRKLTCLVALANLLCVIWGPGGGAEGLATPVPKNILSAVGLKPRDLDPLALELKDILDKAGDLLDMAT